MLAEILETRFWWEYKSKYLAALIPKEKEEEIATAYFTSFNYTKRKNARCWFLKYHGEYAGIFMGTIEEECFDGTFYGILPAYRGKGLSKKIYQFMDSICHENGLKFFQNDVHFLNLYSQRSAVSQQVVPKEIYFNIVLFSLFHKTHLSLIHI